MLKCGQRATSPPRREREPLVLLSSPLSGLGTKAEGAATSGPGTGTEELGLLLGVAEVGLESYGVVSE